VTAIGGGAERPLDRFQRFGGKRNGALTHCYMRSAMRAGVSASRSPARVPW
jgi:hypothetical protein